jgi:multiple sugar transport system ATP-binding protein
MASVKVKNLLKRYNNVVAVNHATLEIEDGEFIILLGPSGCGKSTLLYCIAGLEDISGGEIYIGDRLMNRIPPKARNIAMVFQDYALYPHMSVYDNMAFGLKLRKTPRIDIDRRVHEAAQLLGIETLLDRRPRQLSGGQRQRVALGRAIVREPDVFLMDEPLSNLDAILRVQMRAEISRLHRRLGTTFIYVTHDQTEAMTMGDRIVILRDGIIQQIGTPQDVYNSPANVYVASFIGTPSMNLLQGVIAQRNGLVFDTGTYQISLPASSPRSVGEKIDRAVIAGIRPSAITLASANDPDGSGTVISGRVEVVEPMGDMAYIMVAVGDQNLIVRIDPLSLPAVAEVVPLRIDGAALHLFDAESQTALAHASLQTTHLPAYR